MSVPALFRTALSGQTFAGIVAYGSFMSNCIEACGMDRIERLSASIDSLDPFSDERDAFATTILGGSMQLAFDSEGRVTLSEELMALANLREQAAFVGKGATFEIWEPVAFQVYAAKARELAKAGRAALKLQAGS